MLVKLWAIFIPNHKAYITISKSSLTSFSDSPRYFDVRLDDETLKNVSPHSVATPLANMVFPVPGGPTIQTPYNDSLVSTWPKVAA